MDGDGDLDAFVANIDTGNRIWLNQGGTQGGTDGIFVDSGQSLGTSTSRAVALGDLDDDGDLDAFAANASGQANQVWVNQGGAQGGAAGVFLDSGQTLGSANSLSVSVGDLDGDEDLDAFVSNNGANVIWVNQGGAQGGAAGSFLDSGQSLGSGVSLGIDLGDLDGDGDLDAFVANGGSNRVWINQGGAQGGTLGEFIDSAQTLGGSGSQAVRLGDVDGDGDLDAFVVNYNADFRTFLFDEEFGGFEGCKSAKQGVSCEFIHSVCRVQLPRGAFRRPVSLSTRRELAL